ncbi:hypothetical protein LCGC14_0910700 [marine sediment metagenome]|uniref:Uncharacterized protein n=1 Tax=marine sediment metagenome TaxID=412755 RepID=A0A0F9NTT9_9ZZZZ
MSKHNPAPIIELPAIILTLRSLSPTLRSIKLLRSCINMFTQKEKQKLKILRFTPAVHSGKEIGLAGRMINMK